MKAYVDVFFDDTMKKLKAKKTKRTGVSVTYNVGLLDFKFENDDLSSEDLKRMLDAYHEKKRFVRLEDSTILEIDDESAKEIDDFLEDFNIKTSEITKTVTKPLDRKSVV